MKRCLQASQYQESQVRGCATSTKCKANFSKTICVEIFVRAAGNPVVGGLDVRMRDSDAVAACVKATLGQFTFQFDPYWDDCARFKYYGDMLLHFQRRKDARETPQQVLQPPSQCRVPVQSPCDSNEDAYQVVSCCRTSATPSAHQPCSSFTPRLCCHLRMATRQLKLHLLIVSQ
jgi:hypothetical protein